MWTCLIDAAFLSWPTVQLTTGMDIANHVSSLSEDAANSRMEAAIDQLERTALPEAKATVCRFVSPSNPLAKRDASAGERHTITVS